MQLSINHERKRVRNNFRHLTFRNWKFYWLLEIRDWKFLRMANSNGVDIGFFLPEKWKELGDIGGLISALLPWVLTIAGVLVFLFLLWGGVQYIFSQGNPKEVQNAQRRMTYAIIGLAVLILAFLVLQAIEAWTGIPVFGE